MINIRWITAQFDSHCAGCGDQLYEGDRIAYDTQEKAAYCEECGEIEEESQEAKALRPSRQQHEDIDDFEDC